MGSVTIVSSVLGTSLHSAASSSRQPFGKESTDGIQRLCCRLQSSDASGKPMWHAHPHISPGIDACGNCTLDISERVVQQHFVVTDVNADGWHPGKLTAEGRSQWMLRVGAP